MAGSGTWGPLAALLVGLALLVWPGRAGPADWLEAPRPLEPRAAHGPPALRAPPSAAEVSACLELLALALRSGCGVVEAVERVARGTQGAAGAELAAVSAAAHWGVPWSQAWAVASPCWAPARMAFALAEEAGVGPAEPVARAAADLRERSTQQLELAAARLGVRIVLPLGLAYLPAFVLLTVVPLVIVLGAQLLS